MKLIDADLFPFPLHSVCIVQDGRIIQEESFGIYDSGTPHRMFSVSKSFTSLAVGALAAQGRLSLTDRICSYFPEYLPADPHPWLSDMTLEDLLTMRTCHKETTFKIHPDRNWTASFFTTPADHRPGQIFHYDTSAAHTMAALVKKLTGKGVLDYLREIFLDRIGFSEDAFMLQDPFGSDMGGSGLICRPSDLVKTGRVLLALLREEPVPGVFADAAFEARFAQYVRNAMSYHVPTVHEGKTLDECMGYGLQFWQIRDGVMMYGMGGQYVVFYPSQNLLFVTTADAQAVNGGTQLLLDEIRRAAVRLCGEEAFSAAPPSVCAFHSACPSGPAAAGNMFGTYRFGPNAANLAEAEVSENGLRIKIRPDRLTEPLFLTAFSAMKSDPTPALYARLQILGDYCGSLQVMMHGSDDNEQITLCVKRSEETLFPGLSGFFEGRRITP